MEVLFETCKMLFNILLTSSGRGKESEGKAFRQKTLYFLFFFADIILRK